VRPRLPEGHRISQGCAATNDPAGRINIGSAIKKCIEDSDVIGARSPVERRLRMRAGECCVDIGAAGYQCSYGRSIIRKVAGPVSGHMEQCPFTIYRAPDDVAVLLQKPFQCFDIALADCLHNCDEKVVGLGGRGHNLVDKL